MSKEQVVTNEKHGTIEVCDVSQLTDSNDPVVVVGSGLDARLYGLITYTASVATQDVNWAVYGAMESDYSDEQELLAMNQVVVGADEVWNAVAYWKFYRVKIDPTVDATHGTMTIRGVCK